MNVSYICILMRTSDQNRRKKRRIRKQTYNYDCNFAKFWTDIWTNFAGIWVRTVKKHVYNPVDLVKSFPTRVYYLLLEYLLTKSGVDTAENEPFKIFWYLHQPCRPCHEYRSVFELGNDDGVAQVDPVLLRIADLLLGRVVEVHLLRVRRRRCWLRGLGFLFGQSTTRRGHWSLFNLSACLPPQKFSAGKMHLSARIHIFFTPIWFLNR